MKHLSSSPRSPLQPQPLPIRSLNHVSRITSDVAHSVDFYCGILGFQEIVRPQFDFEGAWCATAPQVAFRVDGPNQSSFGRKDDADSSPNVARSYMGHLTCADVARNQN